MKKFYFPSLFLLIIFFIIASCQKKSSLPLQPSSQSSFASTPLRINIAHEPQSLDSRKVRTLNDINLIKVFMEGLTRIDKGEKTSYAMAENITVSEDGKTYQFKLREAYWSDGQPVTSQDFVYAWKNSLSPKFNSPNAPMLYVIKNAKPIKEGKLPLSLLGVSAPDDKTLIVELCHPVPYFLELTEHPIFFPVHEKFDRKHPNWAENCETYVSNGPFLMSNWKHHDKIEAKRNPNYWDAKNVHLSQLKMFMVSEETGFKMFDAKKLDWDGSPFSTIPSDAITHLQESGQLNSFPTLATAWIRINVEKPPFNTQKIRRAFALAINRQEIINHVTQGNQIVATGIVPKAMGLQTTPYFQDDNKEEALYLFEEALRENNLLKENLPEIVLTYSATKLFHSMAQAIQDQWSQAFGITVQLQPIESKVFFSRVSKQDYTLSLGSWFADFNDPVNFLEVFKSKSNGTNNTNWENEKYAKCIDNSYLCKDQEKRFEYLRQSEKLLIDEMPIIPIYYYSLLFVKDKNLQDVVLTKMGNIDFKWAYINKEN